MFLSGLLSFFSWIIILCVPHIQAFDKKSTRVKCRFWLLCAIVQVFCTIIFFKIDEGKINYTKTEGKIISECYIDKKEVSKLIPRSNSFKVYYVYEVEYRAEGKIYQSKYYESLNCMYSFGNKVSIYYKKNNPQKIWKVEFDQLITLLLQLNILSEIIFLFASIPPRKGKSIDDKKEWKKTFRKMGYSKEEVEELVKCVMNITEEEKADIIHSEKKRREDLERESIEKQSYIENFFQGKIREMEKMEDFFTDEKNIKKNLDSFFAKQVKILHTRSVFVGIKVEMICLILLGVICVFVGREEGSIMTWVIFFSLLFIAVFVFSYRIYINLKYKYSFSKAKRSFQQLYSDYTDSILKNEIVKSDKNKVMIQTGFVPAEQLYIWFCNDFLLACKIRNYEFEFIRYSDILYIEYYKIQDDNTGIGTVAYNRAVSVATLHDCVKIHYQINNKRKEFKFFTISPFSYFRAFAEKGIKLIHKQ